MNKMARHVERIGLSAVGKNALGSFGGTFGVNKLVDIVTQYGSIESLKAKAKFAQEYKAHFDLATVCEFGIPELNIEKDLDEAIHWYEICLKSGPLYGIFSLSSLGALYFQKDSVSHQKRAVKLFLKAAKFGDAAAEINLAEAYRCGVEGVVNKDLEEAFMWYRRAAGEDHDGAVHGGNLTVLPMRQLKVDFKFKALKLLHRYYLCGDCPEGEPQPIKAVYYLKKAAELGDPEAQKDLGLTYLTGESGIPKGFEKARRWLQKAAKNGNYQAQETLKELDKKNVLVPFEDSEDDGQTITESSIKQYADIKKMERKDEELHPFGKQNPQMFNENTFRQYPDSPTAQRYLKAYLLVCEGLKKLTRSNFTDPEGITLLARGVLYENSITQPFGSKMYRYRDSLKTLILNQQRKNPHFFEGSVFLIIKFIPQVEKVSLESGKLDFRKLTALHNLINLIKIAEPDKPPKVDPYSYEGDYSSWLHVLYCFLGSYYTVSGCFRDGAGAFQKALQCCPNYYEAKILLAYCLMNMGMKDDNLELSPDEKLLESFEPPENQRIPKGDFLAWTKEQKIKKAKELFMEYLVEAPECDKKYPNCHYHLAKLFFLERDIQECIKWKEKGEDSEEKRLPFMGPVNVGSKKMLTMLDMFPTKKMIKKRKCNNKKCKKDDVMLMCPCHIVAYCGSECQKADWKEHKKLCSWKKQKDKLKKDKQSI